MNFDDTPDEATFRTAVRDWIRDHAPDDLLHDYLDAEADPDLLAGAARMLRAARVWQQRKAEAGWACLHWPVEHGGRGATPIQRVIWDQEEGGYGKLSWLFRVGHHIAGPTIAAWASENQKRHILPAIASGAELWCQLFSEPSAGSDLAGLRTRAVRDGGGWVVNGQKVWTTAAHLADHAILLARTDPEVPKHKGLTMFFLDMRSPGVEVRPIKDASHSFEFNEVFLSEVRIPDAQRLGAIGDGWNVSMTTLMNERLSIGARLMTGVPEFIELAAATVMDDGTPALDDRAVRAHLAGWMTRASGLKYTVYRAVSALSRGERPGPENSIGKLVAASMCQEVAAYALSLQGPAGVVTDHAHGCAAARLAFMRFEAAGKRVAGGTDEIMRNIIAERVLGLPGDIRVDRDVPFSAIPRGAR